MRKKTWKSLADSGLDLGDRARARDKVLRFDAKLLEHGDEEIAERLVLNGVESEMLAVLEAAAREETG